MPYLIGLLILVQVLAPYRVWVILFVGMTGALLIGYLWVRVLAGGIQLHREMRFGWVQVGDVLEERFTLFNNSILPAFYVEVRDQSSLPDYTANQVRSVGPYGNTRWYVKTACSQRGLYEIGPSRVVMGDSLGVFNLEINYSATSSVLVTPPVVPLPAIRVASGGRSGDGRPRPNSLDKTVSAGGVREYRPEDALRWIHWPTSAKRDDLFVRVFDGTPAGDWWILLDAMADNIYGEGKYSTLEHGIILAASLAARGLQNRLAVGLMVNSADPAWLPPKLGEVQKWEILRKLALLNPGVSSLEQMLRHVGETVKTQSSLVIVTADVEGSWVQTLIPLVWRGVVPTVILLDPPSFGGEDSPDGIVSLLAELGIAHYLFRSDYLDQPDITPGGQGQWEWKVTASGRAIPVKRPDDLTWKEFS